MPDPRPSLFQERFARSLASLGLDTPDSPLLVALSGGCDSVALLHLLVFGARVERSRIVAAHLDHAMRPESDRDAEWVAGLCRAWNVVLVTERASRPIRSEAEARAVRYRFLRAAARAAGGARILTAHHADDQAETVLFRALRGTGIRGLGGMRPLGSTGIARPLLPFWRAEIRRYAVGSGLRWREDPTNRASHLARNVLRNELIPRIERDVSPAARRNLVRLAQLAHQAEVGLEAAVAPLVDQMVQREGDALVLRRSPLDELHPALATRLVRDLVYRLGSSLSEAGTRLAMQFITDAPSGRTLDLPGGVRIATEFEFVRIERSAQLPEDRALRIENAGPAGEGTIRLGGRSYHVVWTVEAAGARARATDWGVEIPLDRLSFPLELRGWRPGDRIRLRGGTRRLKKVFVDRRVPRSARARIPVLADHEGRVLWIAGIDEAIDLHPAPGEPALRLRVMDDR